MNLNMRICVKTSDKCAAHDNLVLLNNAFLFAENGTNIYKKPPIYKQGWLPMVTDGY